MTLVTAFLAAFISILMLNSSPVFAASDESSPAVAEETASRTDHGTLRQWQCSAHSTHNEHEIFWGYTSRSRHEASDSAVHECEDQSGHACSLHECFRN